MTFYMSTVQLIEVKRIRETQPLKYNIIFIFDIVSFLFSFVNLQIIFIFLDNLINTHSEINNPKLVSVFPKQSLVLGS